MGVFCSSLGRACAHASYEKTPLLSEEAGGRRDRGVASSFRPREAAAGGFLAPRGGGLGAHLQDAVAARSAASAAAFFGIPRNRHAAPKRCHSGYCCFRGGTEGEPAGERAVQTWAALPSAGSSVLREGMPRSPPVWMDSASVAARKTSRPLEEVVGAPRGSPLKQRPERPVCGSRSCRSRVWHGTRGFGGLPDKVLGGSLRLPRIGSASPLRMAWRVR